MSASIEAWQCSSCGVTLDISELGFFVEARCPDCGHSEYVHVLISNYRIESVLGIGGMSVVLRARDFVLNRSVAIKLLNDSYRDQPERIARFENECAMMAKVRHDNVVSVYSAGWARGQFYIAMELVDGQDLETVVSEQGPLDPLTAIDYTIQAVQGLEAAYKAGLLHRDMKPGNIILTQDGRAKVLDFGLALGKKEEDTEEIIWATPYYVPPETLERRDEDARTDIYALGMTLRYLLSGVGTFPVQTNSLTELLQMKLALPAMRTLLPGCDECVCDLVDHMTAFDPQNRPANYRDLMAELLAVKNAIEGERAQHSPEKKRETLRRYLVGGGITLLIGAVTAGIVAFAAKPPPEQLYYDPASEPVASSDLLADAHQALKDGNFTVARQRFLALANDRTEPTLAAWSALHAALLADICGEPETEFSSAYRGVGQHLSRAGASPAGAKLHSLLSMLAQTEQYREGTGNMTASYQRALYNLILARQLFKDRQVAEGERVFSLAVEDLSAAPAPYDRLASALSELGRGWNPGAERVYFEDARAAMLRHDIPTARRYLTRLEELHSLSGDRREEVQVLLEVCEVAEVAIEMLQRKCPGNYVPGASPQEIRSLRIDGTSSRLAAELAVICHLLRGDYKSAVAENPYRDAESATEPFAVIMRDWQKRLKL